MTSSSTLRRILGTITAVGTLIAGVMYATAPTDNGEPLRAEAGSRKTSVEQVTTSESYQGGEEDARGNDASDIEALRREVALLRADLGAVQRRLNQLARRAVEAEQQEVAHGSAVPDGMPALDPRASLAAVAAERQRLEAESEQRILAQSEANEAALQKETEDPTWSGEARDLINGAVVAEELGATSVQDVECRATLCRVEVTHKDRQARAAFRSQFIQAVAQLLPRAMMQPVENEDGSTSSVLYLARDGHDFPQPEATN
ncbi:MAG: hypothetical protein ACREYE_29175 [Gammaproteobacteria bacterium]